MKKKILITGAAGFIGSHLAKRLEREGHCLILLDDFSRGKKSYLKYLGVKSICFKTDLKIYNGYNKGFFDGIDEVYHCASRIGGMNFLHGSAEKELKALQDNLAIDNTVFRICKEQDIKKIIYTSSISVYNTKLQNQNTDAKFSEESLSLNRIDPEGGYGWAKFIGEKQLNMISKGNTNVGIVRIFKSYGPCDDYSDKSGQVVCSLMRKAINYPKEKYVLWGDGSVTRCLVYIDDLIDGLLKVSNYINKKSITVNMGGKEPIPIISLSKKIIEISNKNILQEHDMGKPTGVKSRIPILIHAKELLDWEPTTSLNVGLKKTYKWMENEITKS